MGEAIRRHRRFTWAGVLVVLGLIALAGGFAAGNTRAQTSDEATPASETDEGTPAALPTEVAPPTPTPDTWGRPVDLKPTEILSDKGKIARPFGLVDAEPYRVFTGDGDCLNVRYVPGTLFENDPRACVPEGFLLWIYGPENVVDGEGWRYALGEGWVASQYIQPVADAVRGLGPFDAVTVGQYADSGTAIARIDRDGGVTEYRTITGRPDGMSTRAAVASPDGNWSAYTDQSGPMRLVVVNLANGSEQVYPMHTALGWSADGKLLVTVSRNCSECTTSLGWVEPSNGVVNELPDSGGLWPVWAPDGRSVVGTPDGMKIVQVFLDGTRREIDVQLGEGAYLGELSVSPDGTRVMSSSTLGDVRIFDLATGAVTEVARASQVVNGGKGGCGGSIGRLSTWLDDNTVVWHESYGLKGQNGITVVSLDTGTRNVIPFFSIQDVTTIGAGYVSFTTWEWPDEKELTVTWLLDVATGEARPAAFGAFATWQ